MESHLYSSNIIIQSDMLVYMYQMYKTINDQKKASKYKS